MTLRLSSLRNRLAKSLSEGGFQIVHKCLLVLAFADKFNRRVALHASAVITVISNMLIGLMVAMSHKDLLSCRQWQKQGP